MAGKVEIKREIKFHFLKKKKLIFRVSFFLFDLALHLSQFDCHMKRRFLSFKSQLGAYPLEGLSDKKKKILEKKIQKFQNNLEIPKMHLEKNSLQVCSHFFKLDHFIALKANVINNKRV
jgi:hypothetical protein